MVISLITRIANCHISKMAAKYVNLAAAYLLSDNIYVRDYNFNNYTDCMFAQYFRTLNQHYVWVIDQQRHNTNPAGGLISRNGFSPRSHRGNHV